MNEANAAKKFEKTLGDIQKEPDYIKKRKKQTF